MTVRAQGTQVCSFIVVLVSIFVIYFKSDWKCVPLRELAHETGASLFLDDALAYAVPRELLERCFFQPLSLYRSCVFPCLFESGELSFGKPLTSCGF